MFHVSEIAFWQRISKFCPKYIITEVFVFLMEDPFRFLFGKLLFQNNELKFVKIWWTSFKNVNVLKVFWAAPDSHVNTLKVSGMFKTCLLFHKVSKLKIFKNSAIWISSESVLKLPISIMLLQVVLNLIRALLMFLVIYQYDFYDGYISKLVTIFLLLKLVSTKNILCIPQFYLFYMECLLLHTKVSLLH